MIKALLWDNDGIIVDTERLFLEVNQEIFAEQACDLTERDYFDWFLVQNRGAWHLLRNKGYSNERIAAIKKARDRRFTERVGSSRVRVVAEVAEALRALAPSVVLALVTSSSRADLSLVHRSTGLLPLFSVIVTADDCGVTKPSPEPYETALHWLGLPPDACLAIEDSPRGLLAATGAGIRCVVVRTALTAGYPFAGAHAIVESHAELLPLLQRLMVGV